MTTQRVHLFSRRGSRHVRVYAVLTLLALFALLPLIVLAFNSLKSNAEIGRNPFGLPEQPRFSNFGEAWEDGHFATSFANSVVLVAGTVIGVWAVAGPAAYALSRFRPRGADLLLVYLVAGTAIPLQLFLVPLFFLWSHIGLVNNLLGLVIIYVAINSPFATLLLRSYFLALPADFEEAARVDGAGELSVLTRVVVPLAWPALLTVGLIAALAAWNEFFLAITFIQDNDLLPVTTSFLSFQQRFTTDWGLTSAAALLMTVPVVVIFVALQRHFIEGMASGGLRG
jgi:raffinose/stachyose/melibiose transport system permease protein